MNLIFKQTKNTMKKKHTKEQGIIKATNIKNQANDLNESDFI